jgi:hypothetical protein
VLLIFGQSCQKEISFDTVSIINPPNPVIDSNYVSKIYDITVLAGVRDTIGITTYNYDNLKRVTAISNVSKDLYNYTQVSRDYYYNGTDTLPFKSRTISISANDQAQTLLRHDTSIVFHFFDNAGKNLKDSLINSVSTPVPVPVYYSIGAVRTYTHAAGKVYGFSTFIGINVPNSSYIPPDQKDTASIDALGNVTGNKRYWLNAGSGLFELVATSAFTYDNKQSPFAKLSNFKTYGLFPSGETLVWELPQYSNRVTQNEHHSFSAGGSGGVHVDYSYTNVYNTSNGFVKEITINTQPPNPADYALSVITYRHL